MGRVGGKRLMRLAATASILATLVWLVDWRAAFDAARRADALWLSLGLLCVIGARGTIALRWSLILSASGRATPFRRLFSIVSAGLGFGALLPVSAGADIARGVLLHAEAPDGAGGVGVTVSSIVLDRYFSVIGTLLVGMGGALALGESGAAGLLAAATALAMAAPLLLLHAAAPVLRWLTPGPLARFRPKFEVLLAGLRISGLLRRAAAPAAVIAVGTTLMRIAAFLCIYRALGWQAPFALACLAIPLMLIALMAPITFGGFGVREWALVAGFEGAGAPAEISVAAGVLFFAAQMVASLPAMAMTLAARRKPDRGGENDPGV